MKTKRKKYALSVRREFLSKRVCLLEAERILKEEHIKLMTRKQIAREIYFHAVMFYFALSLESFHIRLTYIKKHADPINLADHGDTAFRKLCFHVVWLLPSVRQ